MLAKYDKKNKFKSIFDPKTGFYARTSILDENGKETDKDPFMASFPELIDIGIMGHCIHGKTGLCIKSGVECYQNGLHSCKPNMTLDNFKKIAEECKGKCFQFALGGCGDPDQHENFEDILKICKENNIVPNFTSSGLGFNDHIVQLCKKYCGAVAISDYGSSYTLNAIKMLLDAGIKTNMHFVLSNASINKAINYLKNPSLVPKGLNAIIFLMHKPVGLGSQKNVLKYNDPLVKEFFQLVDQNKFPFKIGFDSCSIPAILNFTSKIDLNSLDTCEGGRFSMYITADMKAIPCSFDNQELKWAYDISNDSIQNAWNSDEFNRFRNSLLNSCPGCSKREHCMGGCPIRREIVLCKSDKKDLK